LLFLTQKEFITANGICDYLMAIVAAFLSDFDDASCEDGLW
jgi:hypothetical protein